MSELMLVASGLRTATGLAAAPQHTKDMKAWQQQLRRAHAAGWFCRSDRLSAEASTVPTRWESSAQRVAANAAGTQTSMRSSFLAEPPRLLSPLAVAGFLGNRAPAATPLVRESSFSTQVAAQVSWPVLEAAPVSTNAEIERVLLVPAETFAEEVQPAACCPPDRQEGSPIRVHVEQGADGLHLWLGIDGVPAEVAVRAVAVAAELRSECERSGLRLAAVVCNGVRLLPSTRKES